MKHTKEELQLFENELIIPVERILTLIDGVSDDSTSGIGLVDKNEYTKQVREFSRDVFQFLREHSDLDPAYRLELTSLLMWRDSPQTYAEREAALRGMAISLLDIVQQEAYVEQDQLDYWWAHKPKDKKGRDVQWFV